MTRGPLIDAMEEDMRNGNHDAVVTLLASGYQPTPAEWEVYRRAPMGTPYKATTLERSERIGQARAHYKTLRTEEGIVSVEKRQAIILREHKINETEFLDYVVGAGDKKARKVAKRLANALP